VLHAACTFCESAFGLYRLQTFMAIAEIPTLHGAIVG
jgi:hypothetical protein